LSGVLFIEHLPEVVTALIIFLLLGANFPVLLVLGGILIGDSVSSAASTTDSIFLIEVT